jgi:ankyrin repeat protein
MTENDSIDSPLDRAGQTPLMQAIQNYDIAQVEYLINAGANVNFRTKYDMTPHALATIGAAFDQRGRTILHMLEKHQAKSFIALTVKRPDVTSLSSYVRTMF